MIYCVRRSTALIYIHTQRVLNPECVAQYYPGFAIVEPLVIRAPLEWFARCMPGSYGLLLIDGWHGVRIEWLPYLCRVLPLSLIHI